MDPITTSILMEGGKALLKEIIQKGMEKLARRKKDRLTPEDKQQIEKTTEKMIHAATMDDVRKYSPKYRTISAAAKKRVAFKRSAGRKTAMKSSGKKSASKRATKKSASHKAR
jgi:hypothetical protein